MTPFVNTASPFDLHIKTTHCSAANNNGVFIPLVPTNFDGNLLNTSTPDIGADELDGMPALYANAGEDQIICVNYTTLTANDPALQNATGIWSTTQGGGTYSNPQSYQVTITNIQLSLNKYVWSVIKPNCATAGDTVNVLNAKVVAAAEEDFFVCHLITTLNANDISYYYQASGQWSVVQGSVTFSDPSSP